MVKVVVDTSVLIDEIRRGSDLWSDIKVAVREGNIQLMSSVVVLAELWAGESMNKNDDRLIVEEMIEVITFLQVDSVLAKRVGEVIRKYKLSGFDAVIAATTMEYGAELATLNIKHFKNIKGLKLYDENL